MANRFWTLGAFPGLLQKDKKNAWAWGEKQQDLKKQEAEEASRNPEIFGLAQREDSMPPLPPGPYISPRSIKIQKEAAA